MADLFENPMGTDGFEFVEYTGPHVQVIEKLFKEMGFAPVARHKKHDIVLYRQGGINFLLNRTENSFASACAEAHGPCACSMAFRVKDAEKAMENAKEKGIEQVEAGTGMLDLPAIEGIGGSLLYFVDTYGDKGNIYDDAFDFFDNVDDSNDAGLTYIDHLTHNVNRGNMDKWADFYTDLFNFREIRYFDIEGKLTGLKSRAMTSPCGKIRIPINESSDDKSQIEEFLQRYNGEGIQHIALGTGDIYETVEQMRINGVGFQSTPDTYYEKVDTRVPGHGEDVERMKKEHILVDGAPTDGQGLLLQIFTQEVLGPVFFEIIQRKGNEGFGEGNFQALFESLEEDQIRRGTLKAEGAA